MFLSLASKALSGLDMANFGHIWDIFLGNDVAFQTEAS